MKNPVRFFQALYAKKESTGCTDPVRIKDSKRDKPSRNQGSGLPSRRNADVTVTVAVPVVVDEETVLAEVADVDAVTVRIDGTGADVDVLEQSFASCEEVADDCVDHPLG